MLAFQAHLQHKHNLSRQQLTAAGYLEGAPFLCYHTLEHSKGSLSCLSHLHQSITGLLTRVRRPAFQMPGLHGKHLGKNVVSFTACCLSEHDHGISLMLFRVSPLAGSTLVLLSRLHFPRHPCAHIYSQRLATLLLYLACTPPLLLLQ